MAGHLQLLDSTGDLHSFLFEEESATGLSFSETLTEITEIKESLVKEKINIIAYKPFTDILASSGEKICMTLSDEYAEYSKETNPEAYKDKTLLSVWAVSVDPKSGTSRIGSYEIHLGLYEAEDTSSEFRVIQIYIVA